MNKLELLKELNFGESVAEQERDQLHTYFVQTKDWEDIIKGQVDIVYGPKGSGKSALYTLVNDHSPKLCASGVVTIFAENPRGGTAFSDLQTDPPAKELEFVNLWKLYLLTLVGNYLATTDIKTYGGLELVEALRGSKLLESPGTKIEVFLSKAREYIKRWFNVESFEPKVSLNEASGRPDGFSMKIAFREGGEGTAAQSSISVNTLLRKADEELGEQGITLWLLLDRLDVAFADTLDLEANALRALFKVYIDFGALDRIKLKIFLRSDIWGRITKYGFREATHITRATTIQWEQRTLLNLIVRRFLSNEVFNTAMGVNPVDILSSTGKQTALFYRIFPEKIDSGKNPSTLDWIIGRTRDAKGNYCPRDIINLIKFSIVRQVRLLESGAGDADQELLLERAVVKSGLADASREKVEKQLFAEYPSYRKLFDALRGKKAEQNVESLCEIWGTRFEQTLGFAQDLVDIGFWEKDGQPGRYHYWVPFIFREGLDLVQGQAESDSGEVVGIAE